MIELTNLTNSYGGAKLPPRKPKAGEWILEKLFTVMIIAVFIVYLMPYQIAPSLGITPEAYDKYLILWSFLAGVLALPFAWFASKVTASLIRSG